jgi:DNA (cytosine-5)-methyltransferase 1
VSEDLVMANRANNVPRVASEEATPPVLTGETIGVVHARGVVEVQRHGDVRLAEESPVHTVRAGGQHHGVIVIRQNTARGDAGQMATPGDTQPIRALTTAGHQSILLPYYRTGRAAPTAEQPAGTVSTRDRLALVVPAGGTHAEATQLADREPAPTLTATESRAVVWTDEDIDECRFRMFALHEIAGAMVMHNHVDGGPYEVLGNKRERMAQYGNSVTPPAMAWLIARLADAGIDISRIVDLFCGAGGSSIGAELAGGRLVLGLNHWLRAVETHATNFQHADHDCEDISSLTTRQIKRYLRHAHPTVMIAGPECTNHSIAKGAARRKPQAASLFDDGPGNADEQDKSRATMWDVARFAEQAIIAGHPLQAIVVENVVDAFKWGAGDDGGLFNAWLTAIDALGYEHEIVWLNSMFAPPAPDPAPQSRDRMYVVFWLKGRKAPELRVEPPAWCPSCERLVAGQQVWKRPDRRPWGRYGAQYLYGCPACRAIVLPGAFPAISIIDPELPAPKIGERDRPLATNTRERIRRGLERLSNEPFAIRLTHGGAPKPLTLPLVTLTQRHDMAMVMANTEHHVPKSADRAPAPTIRTEGGLAMVTPIAGNTHERSPGTRARDAGVRPLDTVHGTLDRALVVPPMGAQAARPADELAAPTQTTTTRAAVVVPGRDATAAP